MFFFGLPENITEMLCFFSGLPENITEKVENCFFFLSLKNLTIPNNRVETYYKNQQKY